MFSNPIVCFRWIFLIKFLLMHIPREYSLRQGFAETMRDFLEDTSSLVTLMLLAQHRLRREDIVLSATYKGIDSRDHDYRGTGLQGIWMDGAFAFGMHMPGETGPAAIYAFDHIGRYPNGGLDIVQLQAPQRLSLQVLPGRWERFGVELVEEYGRWRGDISKVTIQPVEENIWFRGLGEERFRAGKVRYNVTAERAGYKFDRNLNRFIKDL